MSFWCVCVCGRNTPGWGEEGMDEEIRDGSGGWSEKGLEPGFFLDGSGFLRKMWNVSCSAKNK